MQAGATPTVKGTGLAEVRASVNPQASPTGAWFEYGTTPAFGQRTETVDVGSGVADVPLTEQLQGLEPGRTYYVRAVATTPATGRRNGPTQTLTIPPPHWVADYSGDRVVRFAAGVTGDAAPSRTVAGSLTGLDGPTGVATLPNGQVAVANEQRHGVSLFARTADGNDAPQAVLAGPATRIVLPQGVATDQDGRIAVASGDNAVLVFAPGATGDAAPVARIAGPATRLSRPSGLAFAPDGALVVANAGSDSVVEFAPSADGDVAPRRRIIGAATGLDQPTGVAVGPTGVVSVANRSGQTVTVYAAGATGDAAPSRTLDAGDGTLRGVAGVAAARDGTTFVAARSARAITGFAPGGEAVLRLAGAQTGLAAPVALAFTTGVPTTKAPTSVTSTSARLEGSVDPNGTGGRAYFVWGTTSAYGKKTADVDVPPGTTKTLRTTITGLSAGTTYRYRVVSVGAGGVRRGVERTFTTP